MKKGFTLIELLAIIAILAIIFVIVSVEINKTMTTRKEKLYEQMTETIENAAKIYVSNNYSDGEDIPQYVTLGDLISANLLETPLIDSRDGEEMDPATLIIIAEDDDGVQTYTFEDNSVLPAVSTATIVSDNSVDNKYARNGSVVTLSITFNKSISNTPAVKIGGRVATVSGSGSTRTATYTIPPNESSLAEGTLNISISNYTDDLGILGLSSDTITSGGNVTYDRTPPTYASFYVGGAGNPTYMNNLNTVLISSVTGATQMCVSDTTSCSSWTSYAASNPYTLSAGEGLKTLNVWYRDLAGNQIGLYTDSIIADLTAPVLAISGGSTYPWDLGTTFVDPGVTATDAALGDLTASISINNQINVNVAGTYTVTYNVSDAAGNAAPQIVRTVPVFEMHYTYAYNGGSYSFTTPYTGTYQVELWGAQGGNSKYNGDGTGAVVQGGYGGYTKGNISLSKDEAFDVIVGGKGGDGGTVNATRTAGGYNGGGAGGAASQVAGGGGGWTDLRIQNKYRYVRDYVNGSSANTGNHWIEIYVYSYGGANLALNKPVTGSNTITSGTYITDGGYATSANYGYITTTGQQYVEVDLGAEYDINYVKVWHYYFDSRTYYNTKTVLYSADRSRSLTVFDSAINGTYVETASGNLTESGTTGRIMAAGGGGGASNWTNATNGGYGGGLTAQGGLLNPGSVAHTLAGPGTQTAGGTAGGPIVGSPGRFGFGGASEPNYGGGGGGGYYGGGGPGYISSGVSSGAGGSSFISGFAGCNAATSLQKPSGSATHYSGYTFTNTTMIDGGGYNWTTVRGSLQAMPNPAGGTFTSGTGNTGNGYAKITFIPS